MFQQRNLWVFVAIVVLILAGAVYAATRRPAATVHPATPQPTVSAATPSASPTPTASPWTADPETTSFLGQVPPLPQLVAMRTGDHADAGYDRMSFDFKQAAAPGYNARYVDKVTRDGSGQPVTLPGRFFLQINFSPAQAHNDTGKPTSTGLTQIKSYVMSGDFEGQVAFALGTETKAPFKVTQVHNVAAGLWTIYIDFQQP